MVGVSLLVAGMTPPHRGSEGACVAMEIPGPALPPQPEGLEEVQPALALLLAGWWTWQGRRATQVRRHPNLSDHHQGQALLKPSEKHSRG